MESGFNWILSCESMMMQKVLTLGKKRDEMEFVLDLSLVLVLKKL